MASTINVGVLRALLTLDSATFESGLREASGSVAKFQGEARKLGNNLKTIGTTLTGALTVPIVGAFGSAAKAAIDFESSFAGVRKTVDASEGEFKVLEQQFRGLAKSIPISVDDLNQLGEAAGALGIPKQEIADFTRVIALVGVTTNVTAEQAANDIAKIQNIFGASGQATENFASTLVDLGNKGASTEQEILALASRIASAGNTVGLSQSQVLGFAAAIANVGMEAESGGSAMSRTFNDLSMAVSHGGEALAGFAKVAGMTSEAFANLFRQDAASATEAFIAGLGKIKASGGDLNGVLEELGIKEIRQSDLLRRLAGDSSGVATALQTANQAWTANTALSDEANKRFETLASQGTLLWNALKDIGITLGTALIPFMSATVEVLKNLAPYVESLASSFASWPMPLQAIALGLAALLAAAGPVLVIIGQISLGVSALAGVGGFAGLAASITGFIPSWAAIVSAGAAVVTFFTTTLPAAFGAAIAFLGPQGLIAVAVLALGLIWYKWGDQITAVVQKVYTAVKTWLMDKLAAVWDYLRTKIEAVKGYFKGLYDAVVGNSYIPDMVDGIGKEIGRLDNVFVKPSQLANELVGGAFKAMTKVATDALNELLGKVTGTLGKITDEVIPSFGSRGVSRMSEIGTGFKNSFLGSFGAGLGEGLAHLVEAGIGALANKLRGGEEALIVNPIRDAFFAKYGGYEGLAKQLTAASDGIIADQLISVLYNADTEKAFNAAAQAIEEVLNAAGSGASPAQVSMEGLSTAVGALDQALAAIQNTWTGLAEVFQTSVTTMGVQFDQFVLTMQTTWDLWSTNFLASLNVMTLAFDPLIAQVDRFTAALSAIPREITVHMNVDSSGVPSLDGGGSLPGFATGTQGRYLDFGVGTPVMLHGRERVMTEAEGRADSDGAITFGDIHVHLDAAGQQAESLANQFPAALREAIRRDHSLVVSLRRAIA